MNMTTLTSKGFSARFFAVLIVVSLVMTALPAAFFVANADDDTVPTVTSVHAAIRDDADYKGISVNTDFTNLAGAEADEYVVTVHRSDGTTVTKTSRSTAGFITSIEAGTLSGVTTPIIVQQGTYDEAGSSSWIPAPGVWTNDTVPTSVEVQVKKAGEIIAERTTEIIVGGSGYADIVPDPLSFTSTTNGDGTASATTTSETIKTITSSQGDVKMTIPSGTVITSEGWNGTLIAPTVVSITNAPVAEDGFENPTEIITIKVGTSDGTKVTFDQAVQLEFEGQSGNSVGWSRGGTFTPITTICSANTQVAANALVAEGDCKISVGGDLFVWTKHFTDFTVYTQTATPDPATTSSGGSSSGTLIRDRVEPTPLVLGASDSPQTATQELTGVLTGISAILVSIQSGNEAGDISDEDAEKLIIQLGQIVTVLSGMFR